MSEVPPLKKKMMTLSKLQMRILDVLRKVRFQLNRQAHEEGMSDAEFIDQVLSPLETDIYQDRHITKMHRQRERMEEVGKKIRATPLGKKPYDGVGK